MELELPHLLLTDAIRELHSKIENHWDPLQQSACQTAAGRALWKHAVNDPLADVLAGETYLRRLHEKMKNDRMNNAREVSGVILAVRTLWFDSKIEAAVSSFSNGEAQLVLLGAGRCHFSNFLSVQLLPASTGTGARICKSSKIT